MPRKGQIMTVEHRSNISKALRGRKCPWNIIRNKSEESRKNMSEHKKGKKYCLGRKCSEATKQRISAALIGHPFTGLRYYPEEIKEKIRQNIPREAISRILKRKWQEPEFIKMMTLAQHIKPNKVEIKLSNFLENIIPRVFCYNGDFRLGISIGGKIPDFVNMNSRKQVIELFGDYWHKGENPEDKVNHYAKYHYDCLVIWEAELGNREKLKDKILSYIK